MVTYFGAPTKACHGGLIKIAEINNAAIVAGSIQALKARLADGFRPAVVVVAGGWGTYAKLTPPTICTINGGNAISGVGGYEFPVVVIDWGDFQSPPFSAEWLMDLVIAISEMTGEVVFCCEGGHGRTGTIVAAVCSIIGVTADAADCVSWLRKFYCDDAVESETQLQWIKDNFDSRVSVKDLHTTKYSYTTQGLYTECKICGVAFSEKSYYRTCQKCYDTSTIDVQTKCDVCSMPAKYVVDGKRYCDSGPCSPLLPGKCAVCEKPTDLKCDGGYICTEVPCTFGEAEMALAKKKRVEEDEIFFNGRTCEFCGKPAKYDENCGAPVCVRCRSRFDGAMSSQFDYDWWLKNG